MLIQGDARRIPLADQSVQMVCTSPPYWGLRDYGLPPSIFGGDPLCEHAWGDERIIVPGRKEGVCGKTARVGATKSGAQEFAKSLGSFCTLCGAWRGCLGPEPTPELYVAHMVELFREVRRVLRDDGTCWVNLGDSYASSTLSSRPDGKGVGITGDKAHSDHPRIAAPPGLKPKDLVGIPWRVALALQADGWWLRSDIIWHKPNVMPESVTDRPTTSHKHLFLLTKSKTYYYDADAIRKPTIPDPRDKLWDTARTGGGFSDHEHDAERGRMQSKTQAEGWVRMSNPAGRNCRTVWTIPTRAYSGAHFATYPPALVEPCILAGTSAKGACPECGGPWARTTQKEYGPDTSSTNHIADGDKTIGQGWEGTQRRATVTTITTDWRPTCDCYPKSYKWNRHPEAKVVPCLVLDPFCGSGTTGMVAIKHGRNFVGLDLSGDYLRDLATKRLDRIQRVLL